MRDSYEDDRALADAYKQMAELEALGPKYFWQRVQQLEDQNQALREEVARLKAGIGNRKQRRAAAARRR